MRKQYFKWSWFVLGLVLSVYGAFSLIYNSTHNKDFSVLGLVFLIVGLILLISYFVLLTISIMQTKDSKNIKETKIEHFEPVYEKIEEPKIEEKPVINKSVNYTHVDRPAKTTRTTREFDGGSGYVKKIGEGPILRISNKEILDMRSNTYYRIEDNYVKQMGYGPVFEISGNRIRSAFGGYLYEISGDSVNKIYGGYFASFSGNYLTTLDLREKYEVPGRLNLKQQLAVVALLFGSY